MSDPVQREAARIRTEWLGHALSTQPADRPAAEAAISGLYSLIGLDPPRFHWASSPVTALATVPRGARRWESIELLDDWPLPHRFATLMNSLRGQLDDQVEHCQRALEYVIRTKVQHPLWDTFRAPLMVLRAAHDVGSDLAYAWSSTQCVGWLGHYDALRQVARVAFTPEQARQFDLWAAVAQSCGWWWPREDVCVVSERPVVMRTEVAGDNGELRLHCADGPAVRYADGWDLYAWHGAQVPAWVVTDPCVRRIERETNVEVRRCAIEHIGWASYIDQAGLRLVASAPDPGNPGSELRLYDMRKETKVLLAVNGSVERDGRRRRYGLTVPGFLNDPIAAAGWTYGLSAEQYSLLSRRT
ncbi:DUF6745 domain-containing protein [Actinomadura rudentiformis]|uniref:DUF6745 domain-containing protein n=1 Tax=Actinomadura rudentiformis TaxID=359158 RepID=A0A6H9YRI0_9ACTN|nr:hypothetical protein [Actinomadura rudentiformis]KAB2343645.1 hypothetical protein F8566_33480 [Actinomadura rudentiformis]